MSDSRRQGSHRYDLGRKAYVEIRPCWRWLPALLFATALLILAGCGDGSQAENVVTTIDGELEIEEPPGDGLPEIEGAGEGENDVALDTVGSREGLEVPPAEPAEPPSDAYRPSERQARQELAVTEIEVLPDPVIEEETPEPPTDDSEIEQFTIRSDIGSFPASIPVTVPGSDGTTTPRGDRSIAAPVREPLDPSTPGLNEPIDDAVRSVDDELGGVVPIDPVITVESDESAPADGPDPEINDCFGVPDCDPNSEAAGGDGSVVSASGAGDAAAAGEGEPDCDERPWARGCPGPAPDHVGDHDVDATFADTSDVDTTETDAQEGVFVPQEIQDALLAPADNDREGAGDGDEADDADDSEIGVDE